MAIPTGILVSTGYIVIENGVSAFEGLGTYTQQGTIVLTSGYPTDYLLGSVVMYNNKDSKQFTQSGVTFYIVPQDSILLYSESLP